MSETSEYIMGQVRSMVIITERALLEHRTGTQCEAYLVQLSQEFEFLLAMLDKHPPHRLTREANRGTIRDEGDGDDDERRPG